MRALIRDFVKKCLFHNKHMLRIYSDYKYKRNIVKRIIPHLVRSGIARKDVPGGDVRCLVPYIECYFEKIFILVYLFKALQIRGADIYFLVCDGFLPACESHSVKNPKGKCRICKYVGGMVLPLLSYNIVKMQDCINPEELSEMERLADLLNSEYPSSYEYCGVNIINAVNDSLLRYYYGRLNNDADALVIRRKYILTALVSAKCAEKSDNNIKPQIVISHMTVYSEHQPYSEYFKKKRNVRAYCVKGSVNFSSTVNINVNDDLYKSDERFNAFLALRNNRYLDRDENEALENYLTKRFSGMSENFTSSGYYECGDNAEQIRLLNIDPAKRNLFMFTNVEWDVGSDECGILYEGVMDWVIDTIEIAKLTPDVHLYIKTHPDESFGVRSLKSVADKIHERYPVMPSNVTIVYPELKIRPYSLREHMDLGIVYFGTLGLELTLLGVPVVTVGEAHYSRKGFTIEPPTREAYRDVLLAKENRFDLNRDLLRLYAYFYFIKTNIPFNLSEKFYGADPNDIRYKFRTVDELASGKDPYLDHLCDCILNEALPEGWK